MSSDILSDTSFVFDLFDEMDKELDAGGTWVHALENSHPSIAVSGTFDQHAFN